MWKARVFTLYPEIFPGPLSKGLYGKALQKKIWDLEVIDIRDSAEDKHKTVDDTPFGGGSGMLLKPNVLGKSLDSRLKKDERVFYLSPKGKKFDQKFAKDLSKDPYEMGDMIYYLHQKFQKRMMVLFTSRAQLENTLNLLKQMNQTVELPIFAQKRQTSRMGLIRGMKQCTNGILLGTNAFWEGVDLPGAVSYKHLRAHET